MFFDNTEIKFIYGEAAKNIAAVWDPKNNKIMAIFDDQFELIRKIKVIIFQIFFGGVSDYWAYGIVDCWASRCIEKADLDEICESSHEKIHNCVQLLKNIEINYEDRIIDSYDCLNALLSSCISRREILKATFKNFPGIEPSYNHLDKIINDLEDTLPILDDMRSVFQKAPFTLNFTPESIFDSLNELEENPSLMPFIRELRDVFTKYAVDQLSTHVNLDVKMKQMDDKAWLLWRKCENEQLKKACMDLLIYAGKDLSSRMRIAKQIIQAVIVHKANCREFNTVADNLKKYLNWKEILKIQVDMMSNERIIELLNVSPVDLRSYDREVLKELFVSLRNIVKDDSEKLEKLIATFNTKILVSSEMKLLGEGKLNKVYEVTYLDPLDGKQKVRIFKPDPSELDLLSLKQEEYLGTSAAVGIPSGIYAHLSSRAVASSVVDKLLNGKNRISVHTEFVIINGQRGILMEKALGGNIKLKKDPAEEISSQSFMEFLNKSISSLGKNSCVERIFERFDPKNKKTIAGQINLQIKDIITGECDRHPYNYYINDHGEIKGIDEDCSFGIFAIPDGIDVRKQKAIKGIVPNNGSFMLRMPPVITQEMQTKIMQLSPDKLRTELEPYISKAEIEATIKRVEKLQIHVNNQEQCWVVESEDALLENEALDRMNSNNSYYKRELLVFSGNENGWNYLREYRDY